MFLLAIAAFALGAISIYLEVSQRRYRSFDVWQGIYLGLFTGYFLVKSVSEAIPLLEVVRWRIKQRRVRVGLCLKCGYEAGELPKCPECGTLRNSLATSQGGPQLSGIGPRIEYVYTISAALTVFVASVVTLCLYRDKTFWFVLLAIVSAWYLYSKLRRPKPSQQTRNARSGHPD